MDDEEHLRISNKAWMSAICFILLIAIVTCSASSIFSLRHPAVSYLRGGRVLTITPPSGEQISFYGDGRAYYSNIFISLSPEEKRDISELHTHWCKETPSFSVLSKNIPIYDIGISCAAFDLRGISVPKDQLPNELRVLVIPPSEK